MIKNMFDKAKWDHDIGYLSRRETTGDWIPLSLSPYVFHTHT